MHFQRTPTCNVSAAMIKGCHVVFILYLIFTSASLSSTFRFYSGDFVNFCRPAQNTERGRYRTSYLNLTIDIVSSGIIPTGFIPGFLNHNNNLTQMKSDEIFILFTVDKILQRMKFHSAI